MATTQASQAIEAFKRKHQRLLPNSYVEATFQLALDVTLNDESNVYKQYNGETGSFELSMGQTMTFDFYTTSILDSQQSKLILSNV